MILTRDPKNAFTFMLTKKQPDIKSLEFALRQFRKDKTRHCVVKKHLDKGGYAVFTEGHYMECKRTPVKGYVLIDIRKEGRVDEAVVDKAEIVPVEIAAGESV